MGYSSIFHLISDIAQKENVSLVLIGGFAINYYKVTRQTVDIDFLITQDDFKKILPFLEKAGYEQEFSQEVFVRLKNPQVYLMDIDFMFVDKDTLEKIIKDSKEATIDNQRFTIPSLNNLIALKLHSLKNNLKIRENKDLPDIINLIRINRLDYKSRDFHQLCLKYGTEEIYQKIIERM